MNSTDPATLREQTPQTPPERLPAVFCSLDTADLSSALALAAAMQRAGCGLKPGLRFFTACGPQGITEISESYPGLPVFLDLKFHDIPNTVAEACRAAARLRPAYLNVHAAGGLEMMRAAADALRDESAKIGIEAPRLLAVTVLTSLDEPALRATGQAETPAALVLRLAHLAQEAGLDGVVCSPHEIETLRSACGPDFVLMVPGIRPEGADPGDQKRFTTPRQALERGATHLVVGRPITAAPDPVAAAAAILRGLTENPQS